MNLETQTGIFCFTEDSSFFDYYFKLLDLNLPTYTDVDKFKSSVHTQKLACLHMPYPYHPRVENFVETVNCDKYIIVCTELHEFIFNFMRKYDNDKFVFYINGKLTESLVNAKVLTLMDWFRETADFYNGTDFLKLLQHNSKQYHFECLLGKSKPHRDHIYNALANNQLVLLKYSSNVSRINFDNTDEYEVGLPDLNLPQDLVDTVSQITYMNKIVRLSQLIPIEIYNKSYFSIVAETNTSNNFCFLTEKTAKPLIAGRLFLIAGNQYSLRTLKSFGFKTFGNVINESYDTVSGQYKRIEAMLEQVRYLCQQDPVEVLEEIQPVLDFNQKLILNKDWQKEFLQEFLGELKTG